MIGSDDTTLRALYYPYSQCLNDDFLRRAVLIFDELVFLGPFNNTPPIDRIEAYQQALGRHGKHLLYAWDRLRPEYEFLLNRNVIRFINTCNTDTDILVAAWLSDLSDEELDKICGGNTVLGWLVPKARIPKDSALWSQLSKNQLILEVLKYIPKEDSWWWHRYGDVELTRLPFATASSLYINQCLLAAEQNDLIPVTDSITHHTLLLRKYERVMADTGKQSSRLNPAPFGLEHTAEEIQKYFILTMSILNSFLSEEELERRTFKELLAYRDACQDDIGRFRIYVSKIVTSLQAEPWTPEFQFQLNKVVQSEIIPEMQSTRDGMKATYQSLFGGIAKTLIPSSMAALTPTLIASFMANLSLTQIVTLGATAFMSGVGLAIPQMIDSWKEYKSQKRNSLTFLSEISNRKSLVSRVKTKRILLFADESILNRQPPPASLFIPSNADRAPTEPQVREQILRFLLSTLLFEDDMRTRRDAASFFEYLADSDDKNLSNRCEWLKHIASLQPDDHIVDGLVNSLRSPDSDVKGAVTMLIGLWKPSRATDALMDCLRQDESVATSWAMTALIRIGGRPVEQFLISLLSEKYKHWHSYAIDGIAILGTTEAIPSLLRIAEDKDEDKYKRSHAALAVAILGSERGNDLMRACGYTWTLKDRPDYKPQLPDQRCLSRAGLIES